MDKGIPEKPLTCSVDEHGRAHIPYLGMRSEFKPTLQLARETAQRDRDLSRQVCTAELCQRTHLLRTPRRLWICAIWQPR